MQVFLHTYYLKNEANLSEKNNTGHCLTHLNKTVHVCEIWSAFDEVRFDQKYLTSFSNEPFNCWFSSQ